MDWIKKPDALFLGQMGVTVPVLVATPADYGLVVGDVAATAGLLNDFTAALAASDAAKGALATAVATKDAARMALETNVRALVKVAQVAPSVTDANRTLAGLPIRDMVRSFIAPIAPSLLVVSALGATGGRLSWNSNGNTPGVDYVVEKQVASSGTWALVNITRKTVMDVSGLGAGVRVDFRVLARRASSTSGASNIATLNA